MPLSLLVDAGAIFGILRIGYAPEHVGAARAWIERRNARTITSPLFIADEAVDSIVICAGETIANAVVHSADGAPRDATITVRLVYTRERIRVEVTDAGAGGESLKVRDVDPLCDENGRGLGMVASLSDAWGDVLHDDGRTVWFEVGYP